MISDKDWIIVDTNTGYILKVIGRNTVSTRDGISCLGINVKIIIPPIDSTGFIDIESVRNGGRYRSLNQAEKILYAPKEADDQDSEGRAKI